MYGNAGRVGCEGRHASRKVRALSGTYTSLPDHALCSTHWNSIIAVTDVFSLLGKMLKLDGTVKYA